MQAQAQPQTSQNLPLQKLHLRFSAWFLSLFITLFFIEVLIALFVRDEFIRPFIGDVLVMILMYCFVRIILDGPVRQITGALLLFAFSIEIAQAFSLVRLLGLQDNMLARIVIGTTFDWKDLLAYTVGAALILLCSGAIPGHQKLSDNDHLNSSESAGSDL